LKNENDTYQIALPREQGQVPNILHVSKLRSFNGKDEKDQDKTEEKNRTGPSRNNITIGDSSRNIEKAKIEECKTEP
jgi:hypothetical protein